MISNLLDVFSVTQYITHPISLAAFAIAAIMVYFVRRNANDRAKITSVREEDRAELIIKTAERLHLDITQVPKNERAALIKQTLKNRITTQLIIAIVIIVLGLFAVFLVYKGTNSAYERPKLTAEQEKEYRYNLGAANWNRDNGRPQEALVNYREAKKIVGNDPEIIKAIDDLQNQIGGNFK